MEQEPFTEKQQVRLNRRDQDLLRKIARAWRCTPSHVMRRALAEFLARNSYLDDEEKKALGITA